MTYTQDELRVIGAAAQVVTGVDGDPRLWRGGREGEQIKALMDYLVERGCGIEITPGVEHVYVYGAPHEIKQPYPKMLLALAEAVMALQKEGES